MKTANQLTFTTYEASLKLKPNDPAKIIFDNIDVKTHVYLALCAQVIKRIGTMTMERLARPQPVLCPVRA